VNSNKQRSHERILTGTRKSTPVTIDVKAVPPPTREYTLPKRPIMKAPTADTISVLPGSAKLAALLAAKEQQEKRTIIGN
jgi:hypothetical protein